MNYKLLLSVFTFFLALSNVGLAQEESDWQPLFADDLSNADFPAGVWSIKDGVITATEDQCIWTQKDYENFILELEFKTAKERTAE